ncbi:ionotropic receptor 75a-like [Diabrotica undecimpunctata]|uniref:ionotropic receptor 75a-like n=1 Tax=Diabrotica undecimpunctata TaxID=50387 RepID=UPI003B638A81
MSNNSTRIAIVNTEEVFNKIDFQKYDDLSIIVDFGCPVATNILQQKDPEIKKFRSKYNWFIISQTPTTKETIKSFFVPLDVRLDSKITFTSLNEDKYELFEVYKLGLEVPIQVNQIGVYEGKNITFFKKNLSFYEKRRDMRGVLIRTGSGVKYPVENETEFIAAIRAEPRQFQKYFFFLFLVFKDVHNFNYNVTTRHEWFGNTTYGIDGGISKLLYENKVDICTAGGYMSIPRVKYHEIISPDYIYRTGFLFLNPGKTKPGTEVLKPFSIKTWYVFVLTTVIVGFAIFAVYWIEYTFAETKIKYSFCTSILIAISTIAQQGSAIVPYRFSGRIIYLSLLIMSMMAYNYYTSSLVSSLLSGVPEVISTIKELYESNLKVSFELTPTIMAYLIQQRGNLYVSLLNKTKLYENGVANTMSATEGLEKIKKGNFAFHMEVATAYAYLSNADQEVICDLADITFIQDVHTGLVLQKFSQYKELFLITLIKMQSGGINNRISNFLLSKKPVCLLSSRVKAVGASELFLVYLILSGGIVLALIIFLIELILHKKFHLKYCCK